MVGRADLLQPEDSQDCGEVMSECLRHLRGDAPKDVMYMQTGTVRKR